MRLWYIWHKTVYLSCTDTETVSKWIQTRFHMTHVTKEYHRVRPKLFSSLWYIRCKPCTNIAPTQTLSSNGPKRDSTWPTHLEVPSVRPRQFLSLWYVRHKPRIYLASRLALSPNGLKQASTWASSPRRTIGCVQNNFQAYGTFGTNHAPILRQD
jgi:hypothetical protein